MIFCFINRALYALLLLFSVAAVVVWLMPYNVVDLSNVEPLKIEHLNMPDIAETSGMPELTRNAFDPAGQTWQAPRSMPTENATGNTTITTTVVGVIRLLNMDGVLTLQGFIPIGKSLNGGILVGVGQGKYILETEGQRTSFTVDSSVEKRRKRFEAMGLPFLN